MTQTKEGKLLLPNFVIGSNFYALSASLRGFTLFAFVIQLETPEICYKQQIFVAIFLLFELPIFP